MSISNKARKILWANSGNRCAICKKELIRSNIVLGEECHIISRHLQGPRHLPSLQYDAYENLILLCPDHHKIIDSNQTQYTVECLMSIKYKHELWVKKTLGEIENNNEDSFVLLTRINTGVELANIISSHAHSYQHDIGLNDNIEMISEFFDFFDEWNDLWGSSLSASQQMELAVVFDQKIKELNKHGFVLFGKKEQIIMLINNEKVPWKVNYLFILHKNSLNDVNQDCLKIKAPKMI